MTKILLALVVSGGALASVPALVDVTYYGTSDRMTVSQEQNNADGGPVFARGPADAGTEAAVGDTSRVYGYPTTSAAGETSARPDAGYGEIYLGTSWRYQDNADPSMR